MACAATVISKRLLLALAMIATACSGGEKVTQPFPFNHEVHVKADVECLQCHEGVLDSEEHRLPTLANCIGCHGDVPPADRKGLVRLAELAENETEFEWDPALRLADHVFFSHLRHVDIAELECVDCHGDMPSRTRPPSNRRTVTMDECIECHENNSDRPSAKRAVTDCGSCHR